MQLSQKRPKEVESNTIQFQCCIISSLNCNKKVIFGNQRKQNKSCHNKGINLISSKSNKQLSLIYQSTQRQQTRQIIKQPSKPHGNHVGKNPQIIFSYNYASIPVHHPIKKVCYVKPIPHWEVMSIHQLSTRRNSLVNSLSTVIVPSIIKNIKNDSLEQNYPIKVYKKVTQSSNITHQYSQHLNQQKYTPAQPLQIKNIINMDYIREVVSIQSQSSKIYNKQQDYSQLSSNEQFFNNKNIFNISKFKQHQH